MKHRSRKPKPKTGMELHVTLSMSADVTVQDNAQRIVRFFEIVNAASAELEPAWIHVRCAGIPTELEDCLQAAFDALNKKPSLTLVIDNSLTDPETIGLPE